MELGLFTRIFEDVEFEKMADLVSNKFGVYNLELTANYNSKHINILKPETEKIQKGLEEYNLRITNLAIHRDSHLLLGARGVDTNHFYKGNIIEQQEYAKKVLYKSADIAHDLNIPVVVGNIGCEYFGDFFDWPVKTSWNNQLEKAQKIWMPILEYYYKLNVKFAHEIGPQQLAYDLETSFLLLDKFQKIDSFGYCVDPSQLLYTGVNICQSIELLGDRVFHFHAKDAEFNYTKNVSGVLSYGSRNRINRGYRNRIPGWGDVDWRKVLTSLRIVNYAGPISIEIDDPFISRDEAILKSISYLSPLLF